MGHIKVKPFDYVVQPVQLSRCQKSLLLGGGQADSRITEALKFACELSQIDQGIFIFSDEPYAWHFADQQCQAFAASAIFCEMLAAYFLQDSCIDQQHADYAKISQQLNALGFEHHRLAVLALKYQQQLVGYVILFDDQSTAYDVKVLEIIIKFLDNLLDYLYIQIDYADLKHAYAKQSALNTSKNKFFQIIAHDLRAPFHGLLGFSEVLAQEWQSLDHQHMQEIADYLFDTTQSTYKLLENLLAWAMAEDGQFVCCPVNFNLFQTSQVVIDVLSGLAIKKNIKLVNKISRHIYVYADLNMMISVLQNLLSNAVKFSPVDCQAEVTLSAEIVAEQVHIVVEDAGSGMSQTQIEALFQSKIMPHIASENIDISKGVGLGLLLCKHFIDLNHGHISVSSQLGQGSRFSVYLPQAKSLQHTFSI